MYVSFDEMNKQSRIWIFQSNGYMEFEKVERLSAGMMNFLDKWQAHGHDLKASFTIIYNRFLVVALDEKSYQATGCSIDKLVHWVQSTEKELDVSLMDRSQVSFRDENNLIITLNMNTFREMLENGDVDENTTVFNNLIETKQELESAWEVPLGRSWHKQWLPVA